MVLRRTPGRRRMPDRRRTMTKVHRETPGRQAMPGRPLTEALRPMPVRRAMQALRPTRVRRAMQAATTAMAPRRMPARRAIPVRRSMPGRPTGTKPGTDRPTASRPAIPALKAMAIRATATTAIRAVREIRAARARRRHRHRRLEGMGPGTDRLTASRLATRVPRATATHAAATMAIRADREIRAEGPHRRLRRRRRPRAMGPETDRLAAFRPATHVPRATAILAMAITGIRAVREMRAE
jgi:hypothetical protein